MPPPHRLPSIAELHDALRNGSLTSVALIDRVIHNHRATDDSFGAYVEFDPSRVRGEAKKADEELRRGVDRGLLHGLPVSVKDLFGVEGYATHAGSARRLPASWEREGTVVRRLRELGAVITGKTHTVEFAFGGLGYNPHWPTPVNPHDSTHHRVPGGSSSGAGVSLVAESAVLAIGTDTAGSVRIPASMTGVVGLKTSYGRWPLNGVVPLSPTLDSIGLLARSVDDASRAFHALDHSAPTEEGSSVRIGRLEGVAWTELSPGIRETVDAALDDWETSGVQVESVEFDALDDALSLFYRGGLAAPEFRAFIRRELPEWRELIDPSVWQRVDAAGALDDEEVAERRRCLSEWAERADRALGFVDVWVTPTVAITPPRVESIVQLDRYRAANLLSLRNTAIANFLGLCAITVPVGRDEAGLPVGLQLMARNGHDASLLAIARSLPNFGGTT